MNVCCVLSPSPSYLTGKSAPSRVMDSKLPCDVGDHKLAASNLCGTVLSVDLLYSFGSSLMPLYCHFSHSIAPHCL
ncbi:hypothetical protein TB1_042431 [Malus domestica]